MFFIQFLFIKLFKISYLRIDQVSLHLGNSIGTMNRIDNTLFWEWL